MKLEIFNLVRTTPYGETVCWSFESFERAQKRMLAECGSALSLDPNAISASGEYSSDSKDCMMRKTYAYIQDKVSTDIVHYDIIRTEVDLTALRIEAIISKATKLYPDCASHRDALADVLGQMSEANLPKLNEFAIADFIDHDLEAELAKLAADNIVSCEGIVGEDETRAREITFDYLLGNRGMSAMLAVIENDDAVKDDVKDEINKSEGEPVFKRDSLYVLESTWYSGTNFDHVQETRFFKTREAAVAAMVQLQAEVFDVFLDYYSDDCVERYCIDDETSLVSVETKPNDNYRDLWEGVITKRYFQD